MCESGTQSNVKRHVNNAALPGSLGSRELAPLDVVALVVVAVVDEGSGTKTV